jgi:hypothetical protein
LKLISEHPEVALFRNVQIEDTHPIIAAKAFWEDLDIMKHPANSDQVGNVSFTSYV